MGLREAPRWPLDSVRWSEWRLWLPPAGYVVISPAGRRQAGLSSPIRGRMTPTPAPSRVSWSAW